MAKNGSLPDWVSQVAARPSPVSAGSASATILYHEVAVVIDERGGRTSHTRFALRVNNPSGRREAVAQISYVAGRDSVRNLSAWLIRGGKEVHPPHGLAWADVAREEERTVYSEYRAKVLDASELVFVGDVFAWEGEVSGATLFNDDIYAWDTPLPVSEERFQVTVPQDWGVRGLSDGAMQPTELTGHTQNTQTTSWTLRDLPYLPDEPYARPEGWSRARVFVSYVPRSTSGGTEAGRLQSWHELAGWWRSLADGQCDQSPAMISDVAHLVAGCSDAAAKARAIGHFVQGLRYVEVSKGVGLGFGYRPRKASEVFSRGWGDCKDKANLMRAMLRSVGIDSCLVAARNVGGKDINRDWPTLEQFNHAILAIRLPDATALPSRIHTATLGDLTFFDPTSPYTVFGDLPVELQGSTGLVIGNESDELVTLPELVVDQNRRADRSVQLTMARDGSLAGKCVLAGDGQGGVFLRALVHGSSVKQLEERTGDFISETLRGATISGINFQDDETGGRAQLTFDFLAPKVAQIMAGGMAILRLDVLSHRRIPALPAKTRVAPVELTGGLQHDEVTVALPPDFAVDELPPKTAFSSPWGSYERTAEVRGKQIWTQRTFLLKETTVPVEDYPKLRQFLNEVASAERATVVLRYGP